MGGKSLLKCEVCGVRRVRKLTSNIFWTPFPLDPNRIMAAFSQIGSSPYIISLEAFDSLPFNYKPNENESLMPIWSKNNLNIRNEDIYFEFEIFAEEEDTEDSFPDSDSDSDDTYTSAEYKCQICNINVPEQYRDEHDSSPKHLSCLKLAKTALSRINNYLSEEKKHTNPITDQKTYFCKSCVGIISKKDKVSHENTKTHLNAVNYDDVLCDLIKIYIEGKSLDSKDVNTAKTETKRYDHKILKIANGTDNKKELSKPVKRKDNFNKMKTLAAAKITHAKTVIFSNTEQKKEPNDSAVETKTEIEQTSNIHYDMATTSNPKELKCKICQNYIPNNVKNVTQHVDSMKHISKLSSFYTSSKTEEKYYCSVCRIYVLKTSVFDHNNDTAHIALMNKGTNIENTDNVKIRYVDINKDAHENGTLKKIGQRTENNRKTIEPEENVAKTVEKVKCNSKNDPNSSEMRNEKVNTHNKSTLHDGQSISNTVQDKHTRLKVHEDYINYQDNANPVKLDLINDQNNCTIEKNKHRSTNKENLNTDRNYPISEKSYNKSDQELEHEVVEILVKNNLENVTDIDVNRCTLKEESKTSKHGTIVNEISVEQIKEDHIIGPPKEKCNTKNKGGITANKIEESPQENNKTVSPATKPMKSSILCDICNIHILKDDLIPHLNGTKHAKALKTISLKTTDQDIHYQMKKTKNQHILRCKLCECRVPNIPKDINTHLGTAKHKTNYENILKTNALKKDGCNYICSVCNIQVMKASELDHIKCTNHINAAIKCDTKSNDKKVCENVDESRFNGYVRCGTCNVVIIAENEEIKKHNESTQHVTKRKLLTLSNQFQSLYNKNLCRYCGVCTGNVFEHICHKSDQESRIQINVKNFKEYINFIHKYISPVNCLTVVDDLVDINFEYGNVVAIVVVPFDQFNGYKKIINGKQSRIELQCKVCNMVVLENIAMHKYTLMHMQRIMQPIEDENCIRQLDMSSSHCILCNETYKTKELKDHILSEEHCRLRKNALVWYG